MYREQHKGVPFTYVTSCKQSPLAVDSHTTSPMGWRQDEKRKWAILVIFLPLFSNHCCQVASFLYVPVTLSTKHFLCSFIWHFCLSTPWWTFGSRDHHMWCSMGIMDDFVKVLSLTPEWWYDFPHVCRRGVSLWARLNGKLNVNATFFTFCSKSFNFFFLSAWRKR